MKKIALILSIVISILFIVVLNSGYLNAAVYVISKNLDYLVINNEYVVNNYIINDKASQTLYVDEQNGAFTVKKANHNQNDLTGMCSAFPNISIGQHYLGVKDDQLILSDKSKLPIVVGKIESLNTKWKIATNNAKGVWNSEISFQFRDSIENTNFLKEILIDINQKEEFVFIGNKKSVVIIDGQNWNVWETNSQIAYVRTSSTEYTEFDATNFFKDAFKRDFIKETNYLMGVAAGFGIYQDGVGLSSEEFSIDLKEKVSTSDFIEISGAKDKVNINDSEYIVQNNVNSNSNHTLKVNKTDGSFEIIKSSHNQTSYYPAAFPSVYKGNWGGNTTSNSGMPVLLKKIEAINSSWNITPVSTGTWTAIYDIKLCKKNEPKSDLDYIDLIIMPNKSSNIMPIGTKVTTETFMRENWEIWFGKLNGVDVITYCKVNPVNFVSVDLIEFINDSIKKKYIEDSYYLSGIAGGFEIFSGGIGLKSEKFYLNIKPKTNNENLLGDINMDTSITSTDVSLAERYLLSIIQLTDNQIKVADVNKDGRITSTDISIIERYIIGSISKF